jgi:hypothetical protein
MFDYEKIYQKSVYKENVKEYTSTWKDAVTKKRIFELVPHIDNLGNSTLEDLQREWQVYEKNTYTNFVESLLRSFDGFEALRLFNLIHQSYENRNDKSFTEAVQCLHIHLRLYPTLLSFFPQNLMLFLNLLKQRENPYIPNIIFISKSRHAIKCGACQLSKKLKYVKCLCSKAFLCDGCQKKSKSKCGICNYTYTIES